MIIMLLLIIPTIGLPIALSLLFYSTLGLAGALLPLIVFALVYVLVFKYGKRI